MITLAGSRVSVCCDDGLWRQGRVSSMRTSPLETNKMFSVVLEGSSQLGEWNESDIYGPGFLTSLPWQTRLQKNQPVFLTHNGREVEGSVSQHLNNQVRLDRTLILSQELSTDGKLTNLAQILC